jgi:hypothetical protein
MKFTTLYPDGINKTEFKKLNKKTNNFNLVVPLCITKKKHL